MVGQFALALAIVNPIVALANLQLRVLLATDARRDFLFGHYLSVRLVTAMIALAIVFAIAVFNDYARELALIVLGVALTKSFDSLSDVFYGLLQQRERMDRIALSLILHGVLQLLVFGFVVFFTRSVFLAVFGMAFVSASILVFYDLPNGRLVLAQPGSNSSGHGEAASSGLQLRWNVSALRRIAWLGLPIGIVTTLNSLTGNVPRYFIANSLGERELGIFAAMFYVTIAGSMIMGAIADPASPRLAKMFAAGDHAGYRNLLLKLVGIALATGIVGFLVALGVGRQILTILYRPEYADHTRTFLWLMAASCPMYIAGVLGVGVNAMRRFHAQVPMPLMNLVFTVALAAFLIPKHGLEGAGQLIFVSAVFSMLSTFLLLLLCLQGDARKRVHSSGDSLNDYQ